MGERCIFCEMIAGTFPVSLICQDELTLAVVDIRQFHPGHVLVMPRAHLADVRELDEVTGAALMRTLSRVTRAVGEAFPQEGLSLWHSIGPAAYQEVPHLHLHIHPRRTDDGFMRLYPTAPPRADRATMDAYAVRVREQLGLGD